jgi:hypothetical protein
VQLSFQGSCLVRRLPGEYALGGKRIERTLNATLGIRRAKICPYNPESLTHDLWVITIPGFTMEALTTLIDDSGCKVTDIRNVFTGKDRADLMGSYDTESWTKKIADEFVFQLDGVWIDCYADGRGMELKPKGADGKGVALKIENQALGDGVAVQWCRKAGQGNCDVGDIPSDREDDDTTIRPSMLVD